jgi:hemolysin activation/secretion protein
MVSATGQFANKNLTSAEKFSIGGDNTVRAFPVGALVGDHGYSASAELRWTPAALQLNQTDLAAIMFVDIGQVTRNHDNSRVLGQHNTSRISGYGVGLNLGYGAQFLLKVSVAWQAKQLHAEDLSAHANQSGARAWAQASYAF